MSCVDKETVKDYYAKQVSFLGLASGRVEGVAEFPFLKMYLCAPSRLGISSAWLLPIVQGSRVVATPSRVCYEA